MIDNMSFGIHPTPVRRDNPANFDVEYRNKRPLIFRMEGCYPGFSAANIDNLLSTLSPHECDLLIDIMISNDNRRFLKYDLTSVQSNTLIDGIRGILMFEEEHCAEKRYLRVYLDQITSWKQTLSETLSTLAAVAHISSFKDKNVGVWISTKGCETPLHFDLCHGFLHQLHGNKTFMLAPPADTNYLYWKKNKSDQNSSTSPVDLSSWLGGSAEERDRQRCWYPDVDNCSFQIARLEPGDVLYTPPGWWHCVTSDTNSVSLLAPFDPRPATEDLPFNVMSIG